MEDRLDLAMALARGGGQCARDYFRGSHLDVSPKGAKDIVTAADHAVDKLIAAGIRRSFPDDGILSEEAGGSVSDILWVVDPIDGTENFARGLARFAISIAVCEKGRPVMGVVYDPMADELFSACRGQGAFLNGEPIRAAMARKADGALIEAGYSAKYGAASYHAMTGRLFQAGFDIRQAGSAALGLVEVAAGRIDGYVEMHLESWDVAAASLIITEAQGGINDFFASDGLSKGGPVVAAADGLWDSLAAAASLGTAARY